jgi:hypothetical protein
MRCLFIFMLSFFSHLVFAQDTLTLDAYLKTQEALARDDFKSALSGHTEVCSKELKEFKKQYSGCTKTYKDIGELRNSFKALSELYLKHGDPTKFKGLLKASCSMAEAKWIQREGKLQNPYYGKSMLECGEKI